MDSHTTTDPWVGTRVHRRYVARELVSSDGDEAVYAAVDEHMKRPVWLRTDSGPAEDGNRSSARRLAVAAALRRAPHPNLQSVLAFGETPEGSYVVTERVSGHSLADELEPGVPLSPNRAFAVLEPVVGALAAAHRVRLGHGRLTAEHVLMADDGRVEVAGFSTPDAGPAQVRADVVACGALLHELLTGEAHSPSAAAPSTRVANLPGYVDALVTAMTAADPELRPTDARRLLPLVSAVGTALLDGVEHSPELLARIVGGEAASESAAESASASESSDTTDDVVQAAQTPAPTGVPDGALSPAAVARAAELRADPGQAPTPRPAVVPAPAPEAAALAEIPRQDRGGPSAAATPAPSVPAPEPRRRIGWWRLLLVAGLAFALWAVWMVLRPADPAEPATQVAPPDVTGMSVTDARQTLQQSGLRVELADERAFSDSVPRGSVAEVVVPDPPVLTGDLVTLVVSQGAHRPLVPELAGSDIPGAKRLLHRRELTVGAIIEVVGSDVPAGRVIGTLPAAGSRLAPGTEVALRVSNGQRSFLMPSFVGWRLFDARHAAGRFTLEIVVGGTSADADTVVSQTPAPGTLVEGGATLTLVTAR